MINIGGSSKQGVTVGTYAPHEGGHEPRYPGNSLVGWMEPANSKGWIAWFTERGDLILYTKREPNGAVIGEPIRVKGKK